MSIREISPELSEIAKKELHEDPKRIRQDLQAIKDWIAKQPHLKTRTDDQWLISFLRGCKYSLEEVKVKIDRFYSNRTLMPEFCASCDIMDPEFIKLLDMGIFVPIPHSSNPTEPRVIIVRHVPVEICDTPVEKMCRFFMMVSNVLLMDDDRSVIVGRLNLTDYKDYSMKHMTLLTPSITKKGICILEAYPIRVRGEHFINLPHFFEKFAQFFEKIVPKKYTDKLFLHENGMESVYKFIPKSILPTEYGGDAGPLQNMIDAWKKKMLEYRNFLLEDVNYASDESKRIKKEKYIEEFHQLHGSFRKMEID